MLTDCDVCRYLEDCKLDPQKQLKKCWRYEHFLERINAAVNNLPSRENNKGQYCGAIRSTCLEGICKDCAAGRMETTGGNSINVR